MGFISDLASSLKDVNVEGKLNSDAEIKKAEYERDSKNYEQKQLTIRLVICCVVFLVFVLIVSAVLIFR